MQIAKAHAFSAPQGQRWKKALPRRRASRDSNRPRHSSLPLRQRHRFVLRAAAS